MKSVLWETRLRWPGLVALTGRTLHIRWNQDGHDDKPTDFCKNFEIGDVIHFLNTVVTGAVEKGHTLTVTYGNQQTTSYDLIGEQGHTQVDLHSDGNGGTLLTLVPIVGVGHSHADAVFV